MKKVFQTIVDRETGNCLQAVVASLFEKKLEEVPHFIVDFGDDWFTKMQEFYKEHGNYNLNILDVAEDVDLAKKALLIDGGVNGYWGATVKSPTFEGCYHAVVIDKDLNIVHDPNPNQKSLSLKPEDIIQIGTIREIP